MVLEMYICPQFACSTTKEIQFLKDKAAWNQVKLSLRSCGRWCRNEDRLGSMKIVDQQAMVPCSGSPIPVRRQKCGEGSFDHGLRMTMNCLPQ